MFRFQTFSAAKALSAFSSVGVTMKGMGTRFSVPTVLRPPLPLFRIVVIMIACVKCYVNLNLILLYGVLPGSALGRVPGIDVLIGMLARAANSHGRATVMELSTGYGRILKRMEAIPPTCDLLGRDIRWLHTRCYDCHNPLRKDFPHRCTVSLRGGVLGMHLGHIIPPNLCL
jgi:hypothetical protein